jgi:steroid 5-alpha reductase family enzyme
MLELSLLVVLVVAAVAFSMIMSVATVIERRTGNAGWVDTIWTLGLGAVCAGAALAPLGAEGWPAARQLLVAVLVGTWAVRLGAHIAKRSAGAGDDPRYAALRQQWGRDAARRMAIFLQMQALVSIPMIATALLAGHRPAPGLGLHDFLGVALVVAGIAGEGLSDRQLRAFRAERAAKGRVCDEGFWGWSRHPNYFFEWLTWVGLAVMALDVSGSYWVGWLALGGPACMYWLLVHVSGIPPLEDHMLARHGAAFRAYQARTSAFFPLPPKSSTATDHPR